MSSIRLLPRQWRLVGKLMMNLGLVSVLCLEHEHLAWLHLFARAGGFVSLEVVREVVLELKGDTAAHDANAVDRIDERLHVSPKDVSCREFDHRHPPSIVPFSLYFDPWPMGRALHRLRHGLHISLRVNADSLD